MGWLKDSAIYLNLISLCDRGTGLVSNLGPLVIEVSWTEVGKSRWGLYSEEQKGAVPRRQTITVLMGGPLI